MNQNDFRGKMALVTGASSGLGVDFATILAESGANLILTARREERLRALADELQANHGVEVHVITMDLGRAEAPQMLYDEIKRRGLQVDILINNAGYGTFGSFAEIPWEREQAMLQLDIMTVVHLTKLFVRDMVARDEGWILQIASIGAYQPSPTYATYSAAKAFVLNFGEALNYELRNTNVKVSVLSPGVTKTEFIEVAGQRKTLYQRLTMMESRPVAALGLDSLALGRPSRVSGLFNRLTIWSLRLMPRRLMAAAAYLFMKESENT
jgi:short-subunit dehydrogenase